MGARQIAVTDHALVSVIVPHFNDLAGLDSCLARLTRQTFEPARCEIIVADNASPQGRAAIEAVIADRARLVIVEERGAGPARNGGVAAASGEILAFTDSDCQPEPNWLAAGVGALANSDLVGGRVTVLVDDPAKMTPVEAFERAYAFDNEAYIRTKGFSVSANLFCRRSVFDKVGGFRVGVSEDLDWCHRAKENGYTLSFESAAVVGHPARRAWDEILRKWSRVEDETFALYGSVSNGRRRWLIRILAQPLLIVAQAPRALFTSRLSHSGQRMSALAMLARLRMWRLWNGLRLLARSAPR